MRTKQLLVLSLLLLGVGSAAQAQPSNGGPTPITPTADPTAVPLDGGASLLLAGGVAYGLRKLRQSRQARQKPAH